MTIWTSTFLWELDKLMKIMWYDRKLENPELPNGSCSFFPRSRINFEPQLLGQEVLKVCRRSENLHIYTLVPPSVEEDHLIELKAPEETPNGPHDETSLGNLGRIYQIMFFSLEDQPWSQTSPSDKCRAVKSPIFPSQPPEVETQ